MNLVATQGAKSRMNPSVYGREIAAELKRALRTPAFIVPTLVLPLAFYTLFAIVLAEPGSGTAGYALATYGVFAALAPSLFGFGAGVAADREAGILGLKQVSPLPPAAFLVARLVTAMTFTLIVLIGLYSLAAWGAGVALPRESWAQLASIHLLAVLPFCLLGLCIGLNVKTSAAFALSNICFMGLAVLGGLWVPLFVFPHWMQQAALALPTTHLAALALHAAGRSSGGGTLVHGLAVAGFVAILGAAAWRSWAGARR